MDKEFIQQQIEELTKDIETKESFLKWAKQDDVRHSLYLDIYMLSMKRDIYLNLL